MLKRKVITSLKFTKVFKNTRIVRTFATNWKLSPVQILSNEHEHILKVTDAMREECKKLDKGGEINKEFFTKAIDFIRNYADKIHHGKEEDILFEELTKDDIEMHCNPVAQMMYEHELGRQFVKILEKGLNENDKKAVLSSAMNYVSLMEQHILKEDNVLFPMALNALPDRTHALIIEKFKKLYNEELEEKYIQMANEMQQK